jgi:[protein-PII] uridylyltransferase
MDSALNHPTPILQRHAPGLVAELKSYLAVHKQQVEATVSAGGPDCGEVAGRRLAKVFDGLLGSLFHGLRAVLSAEGAWREVVFGAVGSYGRGAVAFRSDLDVRFLFESLEGTQASVEAMLYPLWDAGLSIGHQVVTLHDMVELSRKDLPTATSVLDWRTIARDGAARDGAARDGSSPDVLDRAIEELFGPAVVGDFLNRLAAGVADREERYGGSVYLLEPDVKNGPGGLRDLDVANWAARARWRVRDFKELVQLGVLVPREWQQIAQANDFMWRVRNLLHHFSGRRADRLSFERQEQLAAVLGYGEGGHAVEQFMSEYYRQARTITRSRDMVMNRAEPAPKKRPRWVDIGHGLKANEQSVAIESADALQADPALALRLYDEAVRRDLAVEAASRDAVVRVTGSSSFCERLRGSEEASRLFVRLVEVTERTRFKHPAMVQELHDVGLLVAMVPEFAPVVGRVHHDIYHVYTVDAHSVAAVERLAALCRGELASEFPLASRLAAELARPNVLFFATLLHDVGKDSGGAAHSQRGFELVRDILTRLRLASSDIVEVQHLVLEHLTMYHVATRRDIDDPKTIEFFSRKVRGREGLRNLYLLTVCDVSTTSPTALNSWKARMLDELYLATDRVLSDGPEARDRQRTDEVRNQVRALWNAPNDAFLEAFLEAMPERYFYANDPSDIGEHARLARAAMGKPCHVGSFSCEEPYLEIGMTADDRPGLLALMTATLAAARLPVMKAQIFSWQGPDGVVRALDLFWVKLGAYAGDPDELLGRVERDFARLLSGEVSPLDLGGGLRYGSMGPQRPAPPVKTEITIDNRAATDHTVVEVATKDRLGLLFRLASAIQQEGLTIALAKINTEGDRVADVFYVREPSGSKLTTAERVDALKARIMGTITDLENGGQRA